MQLEDRTLLLAVLDAIPDPVCFTDTEFIYLGCNKAFEKAFGISFDEMVGKTDHQLFGEKLGAEFRREDISILSSGKALTKEATLKNPDGDDLEYEVKKAPLRNKRGEIIGIIGVARDITLKKRQQKQLDQARVRAEAAARTKANFLAVMSHEIRTPMNG
ncbi:MAG: PAS domain-containing protein, partial [Gammaproteobacteria bacterium]|nr:PAS domain-containing protein [Gammaproteobacteria bacterium]